MSGQLSRANQRRRDLEKTSVCLVHELLTAFVDLQRCQDDGRGEQRGFITPSSKKRDRSLKRSYLSYVEKDAREMVKASFIVVRS